MVPTIASTITIIAVVATQPVCIRESPFIGGPSCERAGRLAERRSAQ